MTNNPRYQEIIQLEHFHAPGRPYMSHKDRAAQFIPFKSLNGYHDQIDSAAAKTETWETIIPDMDWIEQQNRPCGSDFDLGWG